MEQTMQYFSTKYTVRMLDNRYIPSVCYKLDSVIEPAVRKLAEIGEARMYPEKVRFVNGNPIPVKKKEIVVPVGNTDINDSIKNKPRRNRDFN